MVSFTAEKIKQLIDYITKMPIREDDEKIAFK